LRMPDRSLLTVGVNAMGLKFLGDAGFSFAEPFPTSLKAACFQLEGTSPWDKMHNGICSMGGGADAGRDLLMATISSSMEIRLKFIAC